MLKNYSQDKNFDTTPYLLENIVEKEVFFSLLNSDVVLIYKLLKVDFEISNKKDISIIQNKLYYKSLIFEYCLDNNIQVERKLMTNLFYHELNYLIKKPNKYLNCIDFYLEEIVFKYEDIFRKGILLEHVSRFFCMLSYNYRNKARVDCLGLILRKYRKRGSHYGLRLIPSLNLLWEYISHNEDIICVIGDLYCEGAFDNRNVVDTIFNELDIKKKNKALGDFL